jgi:Fe-S-cluster containining protein
MTLKNKEKEPRPIKKNMGLSDEKNDNIDCFRCGICCTKYHVHVTSSEAHRIADELGISWEEWLDKYIEKRWPRFDSYLLYRQENGNCIFLNQVEGSKLYRCSIHPFRPSSCREWSAGIYRPECQEGLKLFWQLKVNKNGKIEGSKQALTEFHSFLKMLSE